MKHDYVLRNYLMDFGKALLVGGIACAMAWGGLVLAKEDIIESPELPTVKPEYVIETVETPAMSASELIVYEVSEQQEPEPLVGFDGLTAYAWELEEAAKIVTLEAVGEPVETQITDAGIIMRRVQYGRRTGLWGSTVHEILSATEDNGSLAFSTWTDIDKDIDVPDSIREIVYDAFYNGTDVPWNLMWFRADYYAGWGIPAFCIGNTYYNYSPWVR